MAGVDTSIYQALQQPNPVQGASNAVGLAGQVTQTQTAQQQLQARQGLAAAYQQATDPVTGQVDRSKLAAIVSQDPRTAWTTAEVQQGANAAAQGAQTLDQNTWATAVQKANYLYGLASSLGQQTPDQARQTFQFAKDAGLIHPMMEAQIESSIPTDPSQMPAFAADMQRRSMSGLEQLHAYGVNLGYVNNGQANIPVNMNGNSPTAGQPIAGAQPIPNQLTPGEQGALVPVQQADGRIVYMPAGAVRAASGAPAAQGGAGYTGRPTQPMMATNAPATTIGQQAGATQSAQAYTNAVTAGNNSQTNLQTLAGVRQAIESGANLGPGGAGLTQIQSWLVSHGMSQSDAAKVQNSEEAYKLMQQYANQMSLGGTGTDSRLNAAIASNPNPAYSKNTNLALVDRLQALETQTQDTRDAFQASGLTPDKYQSWLPGFQKTHGIAVYQFGSMTPQQQGAYLKSLSPQQRTQFATGLADYQARSGGQ
ncbi:hypothetical protein [Burkholderia gladioli]|uniref:hypothetical protein n=1 Tax=Burkholderia gladioli TaxID=28095 RepID=UPI0016411AE7|nr:hypothetical protein [Burkholderia gladioli]